MAASSSRKGKGKAAPAASPAVAQIPLGKQLAHTDKAVRDAAVRNLRVFLSRGGNSGGGSDGDGAASQAHVSDDERAAGESSTYIHLEHAEMAKLWKGLFYCFWMSDKPLIQQALARDLAELLLSINPRLRSSDPGAARAERDAAALGFLRGFWECMCREWEGIDRLRIDKFYMLIRRFVNASQRLLVRSGWAEQRVRVVNEILSGAGDKRPGPLDPANPRIPLSLATHLADIYLTELNVVLSSSPASDATSTSTNPPPLALLLEPFAALLARSPSPVLFTRLMDTLYRPFLQRMDARIAASAAAAPVPAPSVSAGKKRKLASTSASESEEDKVKDGYEGVVAAAQAAAAAEGKSVSVSGAEMALRLKGEVMRGMFALAAREDAREANRRKVYLVWNEFGGGDGDDEDGEGDW